MKTLLRLFAAAAAAAALLSGCGRGSAKSALASVPAPAPAATYHAARGVQLTALASKFVGLATAEFTAARVPASAVLRTVQGTFVYVENGGWFLRTPVVLGPPSTDGAWFAAPEGLYEGDRIVTRAVRALWLAELHFLRAGQACAHEG